MTNPPEPTIPPPLPGEEASWEVTLPIGQRLRRANLPVELVAGVVLLLGYCALAVYALAAAGSSIGDLPTNPGWVDGTAIGPSRAHPFGVMSGLGVDVAAALVRSTPWDVAIVGGILVIALLIGLFVGALAGLYEEGAVDLFLTFWMDSVSGVPPVVLVAAVFFTIAPHIQSSRFLPAFVLLFGLVLWPYYARPVRARARLVADSAYVQAARASGAGRLRILVGHVLPNSLGPAFAQVPIDVANVFFVLSAFPFVACYGGAETPLFGLLSPLPHLPFPEWGYLLAQGACNGTSVIWTYNHWWMYAFPAAVIVLFGFAGALTCDGIQKTLARHSSI
jgi:peptide/nickel transport system permease protein